MLQVWATLQVSCACIRNGMTSLTGKVPTEGEEGGEYRELSDTSHLHTHTHTYTHTHTHTHNTHTHTHTHTHVYIPSYTGSLLLLHTDNRTHLSFGQFLPILLITSSVTVPCLSSTSSVYRQHQPTDTVSYYRNLHRVLCIRLYTHYATFTCYSRCRPLVAMYVVIERNSPSIHHQVETSSTPLLIPSVPLHYPWYTFSIPDNLLVHLQYSLH